MKATRKISFLLAAVMVLLVQAFTLDYSYVPSSGKSITSSPIEGKIITSDPDFSDSLQNTTYTENETQKSITISEFRKTVKNGNSGAVTGIFAEDRFALKVVQQPAGQPAYVSTTKDIVTEFSIASDYGTLGLMAHNYLAGENFFQLQPGDIIQVVYGDGNIQKYAIYDVQRYQALQPNSPRSQFVDLDTNEKLTATQLFKRIYMGEHHLTLQTCIQQGSEDSWGRLFLLAEPI